MKISRKALEKILLKLFPNQEWYTYGSGQAGITIIEVREGKNRGCGSYDLNKDEFFNLSEDWQNLFDNIESDISDKNKQKRFKLRLKA